MSHLSSRSHSPTSTTFVGLPTGSGLGIVFAALFTGALLSLSAGVVSWPFLALYTLAVIAVTTLVNPKGLSLTVTSAPLMFVAALVATGYGMSRDGLSAGGASAKTALLGIVYPVAEYFPVLFFTTAGSLVIAVVRLRLIRRQNAAIQRRETAERTSQNRSNRRTNSQGRRAREQARSVPVQELLDRAKSEGARRRKASAGGSRRSSETGGSSRAVHRLGEDLYKG